jgi:hypothetical protein
MLAHLHVTMASSRDVKVTLDLVTLHTAIDSTTVGIAVSGNLGSLLPLLRCLGRAEIVVYVLLLVLSEAWVTAEI